MQCKIEECVHHNECGFLDIFKKEPKSGDRCSYFSTPEFEDKKQRKTQKQKEEFESKKKPKLKKKK